MKLLLLGCDGQVGWVLHRSLRPLGEVFLCDFDSLPDRRADSSSPYVVADLVARIQSDVIVNADAHAAADKAESEPDLLRLINAPTVGGVAENAYKNDSVPVHYSTEISDNIKGSLDMRPLEKRYDRAEHWIVVNGTAGITNGGKVLLLPENQSTCIPLSEVHRLADPGAIPPKIIDMKSGSFLSEEDIVRIEDAHGRTQ